MRFIIFILSIYVFIKTIAYSIFEYKENLNKIGGIVVFIIGALGFILPNIAYYIAIN